MKYSGAILFPLPPPVSPLPLSHCPPLTIFFFFCLCVMDWFSAVFSVAAISHRSCPIPPQRHMCRDTDQRRNPHFQAMGLGSMQHKTRNGSLASDSYWCTVRLCVTEQADQHKHAHQCVVVVTCENNGTEIWGPYYTTSDVWEYERIFIWTVVSIHPSIQSYNVDVKTN